MAACDTRSYHSLAKSENLPGNEVDGASTGSMDCSSLITTPVENSEAFLVEIGHPTSSQTIMNMSTLNTSPAAENMKCISTEILLSRSQSNSNMSMMVVLSRTHINELAHHCDRPVIDIYKLLRMRSTQIPELSRGFSDVNLVKQTTPVNSPMVPASTQTATFLEGSSSETTRSLSSGLNHGSSPGINLSVDDQFSRKKASNYSKKITCLYAKLDKLDFEEKNLEQKQIEIRLEFDVLKKKREAVNAEIELGKHRQESKTTNQVVDFIRRSLRRKPSFNRQLADLNQINQNEEKVRQKEIEVKLAQDLLTKKRDAIQAEIKLASHQAFQDFLDNMPGTPIFV